MTKQPRQRGFSLVELMVAMLIGLFLVGGLVYVYAGSRTSYNFNVATANVQENGRFAIHFLVHGLREAGYMGCGQNVGQTANTLNSTADDYLWNYRAGVDGFDDVGATWPPPLDTILSTRTPIQNTDVITVRSAAGAPFDLTQAMPNAAAALHVDTGNGFKAGDILMVTDCSDSAVFQITAGDPDTSGTITHGMGSGSPGNSTKNLGKKYGTDSHVMSMQTTVFYLADSSHAAVSSLWRKVNNEAVEELVPGVENMQILYGEDTDGNRTADRYVDAASVSDMDNVVSVRIALLMTSLEEAARQPVPYRFNGTTHANPGDNYIRREFTATVNLRNRSP